MDKAEACRMYAKKAGMDLKGQNVLAEGRIRAERKAGGLLKAMEKAKGAATKRGSTMEPRLADLGVTKKESHRYQQQAEVPDKEFEEHVAKVNENREELTSAGVRRLAAKKAVEKRHEDIRKRKHTPGRAKKYDVIIIDPPWPMQKVERECRPSQAKTLDYPTMSLDEIRQLKLPCADDCHVWVWTTQKLLPPADRRAARGPGENENENEARRRAVGRPPNSALRGHSIEASALGQDRS